MAYVKNRYIGESGRLIFDIIEIEGKKIEGFLITMDTEKAFHSLDHNFLVFALEKYGFGKNSIPWVKILLKIQESCIVNGGTTTKYFLLGRGTCPGDPITALFPCYWRWTCNNCGKLQDKPNFNWYNNKKNYRCNLGGSLGKRIFTTTTII